MLTEYKDDTRHYFIDAQGRYQGEAKWWDNGNMWGHCFYIDDKCHGERKIWDPDGTLRSHEFYVNGELYRDIIENPVDEKDKFIISLETGGKWIKE